MGDKPRIITGEDLVEMADESGRLPTTDELRKRAATGELLSDRENDQLQPTRFLSPEELAKRQTLEQIDKAIENPRAAAFREGESLEIKGMFFRIVSLKPGGMKLKPIRVPELKRGRVKLAAEIEEEYG